MIDRDRGIDTNRAVILKVDAPTDALPFVVLRAAAVKMRRAGLGIPLRTEVLPEKVEHPNTGISTYQVRYVLPTPEEPHPTLVPVKQ